jgi:tRNA (cmo5U34)-methyltransferase
MKKDDVFLTLGERAGDFEFNAEVAEAFDDMLVRSIPFYREQQHMIQAIGKNFWIPGTSGYDLGCATATTLINLCRALPPSARLAGYDNSLPMIQRARQKIKESHFEDRIEIHPGDLNGQLSHLPLRNASVVTMCWTLQFIRPLRRDDVIQWIYDGLVEDGVLIVTEKVLTNDGHTNRLFVDYYYEFKRQQGYSDTEIMRKRESLENVLIPFRIQENLDLFRRNGFALVETFFQWFNFSGFLCVKKPALTQGAEGRKSVP